jgi:hypothetical protein
MPIPAKAASSVTDVQTVKMDRDKRLWRKHSAARHHVTRHHNVTIHRSHAVRDHMWRGHRGYRYHRPGYRRYHGFWYPPAAFSLGIVVRPGSRHGTAHVQWCRNHYVSYRASDNTFQPYHGPRKQCVSPYAR